MGGLSGMESHKKWRLLAWSAYHLCVDLRSMRADNLESSSVAEHQGWLELWDTNVPGKAKILTRRLILNGFAVGAILQCGSVLKFYWPGAKLNFRALNNNQYMYI